MIESASHVRPIPQVTRPRRHSQFELDDDDELIRGRATWADELSAAAIFNVCKCLVVVDVDVDVEPFGPGRQLMSSRAARSLFSIAD